MKRCYKDLEVAFQERYKYWKKIGYSIEISEDKKHIKFANNHEKIPCYIDIQNGMTICYGDYSEFMFRTEVNLNNSIDVWYLERKCCCGNVNMFDYDIMQEDINHEINDLKELEYKFSDNFEKFIKESFNYSYNGNPGELDHITEEILSDVEDDLEYGFGKFTKEDLEIAKEIDCFDWKESLYDSLGFGYDPHFVAQLAILQIAHDELMKGGE